MAKPGLPHIAILGAGPIGLEAALYASHLNFPFTIYERAEVGDHLRQWGHVRLFSPFRMNTTTLGLAQLQEECPDLELPELDECITGHRHLEAYLEPLAHTSPFEERIQTRTEVLQIGRRGLLKHHSPGDAKRGQQPFLLQIRDAENHERVDEADIVLDCTGTYGQPRWLGDGGLPAFGERSLRNELNYRLVDVLNAERANYSGKTTLVIGSGYSAATTVCQLAELADADDATWIVWLIRGNRTPPLKRIANDPLKERDRLAMRANTLATRAEGNLEFHSQAVVERLEKTNDGYKVDAMVAGRAKSWEVENIIANIGYTPNNELYRELQVHECYASLGPMNLAAALLKQAGGDCLKIGPQGAQTLRNPEPNFYILGSKSYGRGSNFLLRTGFEQIREVFTLLTGKKDLNLYR